MPRCRLLLCLCLCLALVPCFADELPGTAFWVWHRDSHLSQAEAEQLRQGHCDTLYWHVGMVAVENGAWVGSGPWLAPATLPADPATGLRCVPVLRGMLAGVRQLPADHAALLKLMQRAMQRWQVQEVQLDFDCPDRLLPEYARQLQACHAALGPGQRLSITALAGWASLPAFPQLADSVDELLPMFYDLEPDAPKQVQQGHLLPLLSRSDTERHLRAWSRCKTPWRVGLPCFARLSVFDPTGVSRGHFREWSWDEVAFHADLRSLPVNPPAPGVTILRATKDTYVNSKPLGHGHILVARRVDRDEARVCITLAREAGAASIVWFRLPTRSAASGWSLAQTLACETAEPRVQLVVGQDSLRLENLGTGDLAQRWADQAESQRGWQLELEHRQQAAVFRDATPGDFAHAQGHREPDAQVPQSVSPLQAVRLTFWLSDLKAGATRRAGVFRLAPDTDLSSLRWRLRGGSDTTAWQSITPFIP